MKLKISFIFFHTLLVASSAGKVKEDSDYRNNEQSLGKQKSLRLRSDLLKGDSHSTSEDLSKLQYKVSLLEGSISQINEQVTQISNRNKELSEAFQEQQELLRTISGSIAGFHGEFSNVRTRLTQLENMRNDAILCGGRLLGESGVISYKEYEMYNNSESCSWIIEVPEALKIGFKLEKSGLERCCDGVNVTSLDTAGLVQQPTVKLKFYHHTVFVDGPKAMVRFTSDSTRTSLGFRLSYYKITDLNSAFEETIKESECGGVIVGETGVISYKLDEIYLNNERCVWLVHSPNSTSITFHLRHAGFGECCDALSVTTVDSEAGALRNDTQLLTTHNETVTIQESIAAIVFNSNPFTSNTGFYLTFAGSGFNNNSKYVYKLRHIAKHNETIEYSASDRNDDEITMQQHIYVTATSAKGDKESSRRFVSGIDLNAGIFLRANDSFCVYDSLTFYEAIPPAIARHNDGIRYYNWQKKAQIPSENDTLLCPKNVTVPQQMALLEFDFHSFLAIYKPISKDTFESNAVVSFDYYYKPNTCVEILKPLEDEFGIITYKENENYENLENSSWIIEVTNATRIDFNLEQSGLEECCDYLSVTSLDVTGQIQGPKLDLRVGSPTASVTGSLALVNFISDETDVGSGFRLRYERGNFLDEENACDEVLNPMLEDYGVINYKANENYANNEKCQWRIETPEWGRIGFTLEQSGFEECCDYVTISSVAANGTEIGEPVQLKYHKRNASLTGPTILVRFTSDLSGTGTGFRLRFEKLPVLGYSDAQ